MNTTSTELKLSFDFVIIKYEERIIDIEVKGFIKKIEYCDNFFSWFMEDLIYFLEKNGFQKRWDFEKMRLHNIKTLKLGDNHSQFVKGFKSVTSWEMEEI